MSDRLAGKRLLLGAVLMAGAGAASAQLGYLNTTRGTTVTSGSGLCWHTSAWTPLRAVEPCDPVPRAKMPDPVPLAVVQPPAAPAPARVAPEPPTVPPRVEAPPPVAAPVIHRVSLSTELLFNFDSAELRPEGEEKLRALAKRIGAVELESLSTVGYADRIGTQAYNLELSQRRAESVKDYLGTLGVETKRVQTAGEGEGDPLTAGQCSGQRGADLIRCLQPDRRVEIEVRGYERR